MTKILIHDKIPEINKDLISDYISDKPDIFVFRNTISDNIPLSNIILILTEPPLTKHRQMIFDNIRKFHTVYTYANIWGAKNVFPFCENPAWFPYYPVDLNYHRKSLDITTRKVYQPGMRGIQYAQEPDIFGRNLYPLRNELGKWLISSDNGYPVGLGWKTVTKSYTANQFICENVHKSWRMQKPFDCDNLQCDFIIALHNYSMMGHTDERFHDAIQCQRAVFYLGAPDITSYVPEDCFINLHDYLLTNETKLTLDYKKLDYTIKNISQFEYERMIINASEWQNSIKDKHIECRNKLTEHLISRL